MDYQVVVQDVGSMLNRNVDKAVAELAAQVQVLVAQGWTPQGGLATVEAGGGIFLLQAMVRASAG
jgi:hypothetical protein